MREKVLPGFVTLLAASTASALAPAAAPALPPLPDKEGFAGAYAGVSGGALLVAGGANFPGKKPWEGGAKAWYDAVFVLDRPDGQWRAAGKLFRPLGYGVSVTHRGGVVCAGGADADRHYADVFRLEWKDGRLVTTRLPPLPRPVANGCGALVGDTLYVAGGQESPTAARALDAAYALDLGAADPAWRALPALPGGGRILAAAAGFDGAFWVAGGASLAPGADGKPARTYRTDAYRYDPAKGWTRVADLPRPAVAAPSPAPADEAGWCVLGGDDGTQVGIEPAAHRGFSRQVLRYDVKADKWAAAVGLPAAHVTAPCVWWAGGWRVASGEVRPGVRSPQVLTWDPDAKE